jgi:hypothetical protein
MRRILVLSVLIGAVLIGAADAEGARLVARANVEASDVEITALKAYQKLAVEGCISLGDPGEPELPVRVLRFVIPSDMGVDDVVISSIEEEELVGTYRVAPAQVEVPMGESSTWTEPDRTIYEGDVVFPQSRVRFLGEGNLGGYRIASVAVYPITYAPRSGRLTIATELEIGLTLTAGGGGGVRRQRSTERSHRVYEDVVRALVENPEDVGGVTSGSAEIVESGVVGGFQPRYSPSLEGSPVDYVIVTNDELAPYFQQLADRKTKKGVPAVVKTVSWIEASYPGGCDRAERIRLFLKDAFASWGTTYVLLGGDTQVVPVRYAYITYYGGASIPTDLYYSDLDGNWNGDGDSVFGEGYSGPSALGDDVDLFPDVFVGRAPVNDIVQAEAFLAKCEAYEDDPALHFTDRNLYLAEVVFPYNWEAGPYSLDGASDVIEPMLELVHPETKNVRLYANHEEFPGSLPLSAPAALDSLDAGYNLVFHVGHANKDIIRVSNDNYITMADMSGLSNGTTKASFLWLLNCTSAAIDSDCIAERAVNNPNGGAVAVFGPTRYSFPATMTNYLHEWTETVYSGSAFSAGEVCAITKAAFAADEMASHDGTNRWTQFSTLLLGDPELPIWTTRARELVVAHDSTIQVGEAGLTVSVSDVGPVEGALVCVYKEGDVYALGHSGPDGAAQVDVRPHTTGTLAVTVSARGYTSRETSLEVLPATGAHVYLTARSVDDGPGGMSEGNGNGAVEPGEIVELGVSITNSGTSQAGGVSAALSTEDPYVVIEDDTEFIGDIDKDETVAGQTAFRFSVDPGCPNDHDITFGIAFEHFEPFDGGDPEPRWRYEGAGDREASVQEFQIRVVRPELAPLRVTFDDTSGNSDGFPDVGETVGLLVEVWNDGNGDARDVTGTLRFGSQDVTLIDSTASWGAILAGELKLGAGGFEFVANQNISADLEVVLTDAYGSTWHSAIDVFAPSAPGNLSGRVKGTTISLSWTPVSDPDLRGYEIMRSEHELGPFVRVNDAIVEGVSFFSDTGLAEETLYYYNVSAVDSSGNSSAASELLTISTNPPSQSGWPAGTSGGMYASPGVADIDGDGELEIIITSDELFAWNADGTEVLDGDGDPRTGGVLVSEGTAGYRSSVALGEVDGDAGVEIVAAPWGNVGTDVDPVYEVYAWNGEDGSVLPGWPVVTKKFCWATPALADLDVDGRCEVILPCADGYLYCWRYDGTEYIDGDDDSMTTGPFAWLGSKWTYGSPAIADLDSDLSPEIIQPSVDDSVYAFHADGSRVEGWPVSVLGRSFCSPAVGDVDNDGQLEVVLGSNAERVWLVEADGTVMDGWPVSLTLEGDFPPSPALADLTDDGFLEVILVGSDGEVTVRDYLGRTLTGWPQMLGGESWSSPAIADIDGDPAMEIVVGSNDGKLYCFDTDGSLLRGWPIQTDGEIYGSPAVSDLDGDGDVEVIIGGMDTNVYIWDTSGLSDDGERIQWGQFLHDPWRSQNFGFEVPTGIDEVDGWSEGGKLLLEQNSPNPFNPVTSISFTVSDRTGSHAHTTLVIYGVSGSVVRTLVDQKLPAGESTFVWDGRDASGEPVASGVYFYRLTVGGDSATRKMTLLK